MSNCAQPSSNPATGSLPPSAAKGLSLTFIVKGKPPSWNVVLDLHPYARRDLRFRIQDDVLSASKATVKGLPIPSEIAQNIISTVCATKDSWRMIMKHRSGSSTKAMKELLQLQKNESKSPSNTPDST